MQHELYFTIRATKMYICWPVNYESTLWNWSLKCEVLRSNRLHMVPCADVTLCTGLGKHLYLSVAWNYCVVSLTLNCHWAVSATSLHV